MRPDTLYYDAQCGLCTRSARLLGLIDWLGATRCVASQHVPDAELPVSRERALEAIPMKTADGRVLEGFPAVRRALRRTVLGFLPALVMHLPGVSHAGHRVYSWVAANRTRSPWCAADGACEVGRD